MVVELSSWQVTILAVALMAMVASIMWAEAWAHRGIVESAMKNEGKYKNATVRIE